MYRDAGYVESKYNEKVLNGFAMLKLFFFFMTATSSHLKDYQSREN